MMPEEVEDSRRIERMLDDGEQGRGMANLRITLAFLKGWEDIGSKSGYG